MKNDITIEKALDFLDDVIHCEIQKIIDLNQKAVNFQKLVDEKYLEMARIYEKLGPCEERVKKHYHTIDELNLLNKLEIILSTQQKEPDDQ